MPSAMELYESANIQKIDEAAIAMERAGFLIDVGYLDTNLALARADERSLLSKLAAGLAQEGIPPLPGHEQIWSSSQQVIKVLHDKVLGCGIDPSPVKFKGRVKVDEGERSVDKAAIAFLRSRVPDNRPGLAVLLDGIAELRKTRNCAKYLEKLPRFVGPDGFVHPVTGPAGDDDDRVGAITGRFGMKNPEGQQIPKHVSKDPYRIRKAFIAPPGMSLISADYSALEVVILANLGERLFGDTTLLDQTGPGQDVHAYNAHRIFGSILGWTTPTGRKIADYEEQSLYKSDPELSWYRELIKSVWYKLMYGGTAHGFGHSLKGADGKAIGTERATEILDALYEACPVIRKVHAWVRDFVRKHRGMVAPDGRWVDYSPLIERGKWGFEAACRGADNFPMQAKGANIIGNAMVAVNECDILPECGAIFQLQVHDELVFRVPDAYIQEAGEVIQYHMENACDYKNLRATWGFGKNWFECK